MRIGIDLGGTKIEAAAFGSDNSLLGRHRVPTPCGNYAETVRTVAELVFRLERELGGKASVGIGIPGAISPATGLIKNANSTWLIGKPLDHDLAEALHRPVRLANDANCFAISEAADGAAAGAEAVFGVIVGTGTGGGIVVRGRALVGANAIAGEWGHNPLPWPTEGEEPGPQCYCGKRGCIETWLSGPGLARAFHARTGRQLTAEEIVQSAAKGDREAEREMRNYEDRMARSLAGIINILDPDVIVLGGGMSKIERLYRNVPRHLAEYVFSDRVDTVLLPPMHGDSSGVRGAAWLWP